MIKTRICAYFLLFFNFCTQNIHGIIHHIYVVSFKMSTSSLKSNLNSKRGNKHLYFYHLPLNQLKHNKYVMTTYVHVLSSLAGFIFLSFCYQLSFRFLCYFYFNIPFCYNKHIKRHEMTSCII